MRDQSLVLRRTVRHCRAFICVRLPRLRAAASTACAGITQRAQRCARFSGNARVHLINVAVMSATADSSCGELSEAKHLCLFPLVDRSRFDPRFFASLRMTFRIYQIPGSSLLGRYDRRTLKPVYRLMGDPRNVAHAKKVTQEKQHKAKAAQKTRAPQPARKAQIEQTKPAATEESATPKQEAEKPPQPSDSAQSEKSHAVLSKLKELEFHSRATSKSSPN